MVASADTMEKIRKEGTTFDEFANIARKHVYVDAYKASESSLEHFIGQLTRINSSFDSYMVPSYSRKIVNQVCNQIKITFGFFVGLCSLLGFLY